MPIRPENRDRYPADWSTISERIRLGRAGGCCECTGECDADHGGRCGAPHLEWIQRAEDDPALWRSVPGPAFASTADRRRWNRPIRVVLTVAHLDHVPEHCDDDNLLALCQRCHLRYDSAHHAATRARTAARRAGQELLPIEVPDVR